MSESATMEQHLTQLKKSSWMVTTKMPIRADCISRKKVDTEKEFILLQMSCFAKTSCMPKLWSTKGDIISLYWKQSLHGKDNYTWEKYFQNDRQRSHQGHGNIDQRCNRRPLYSGGYGLSESYWVVRECKEKKIGRLWQWWETFKKIENDPRNLTRV